LFADVDFLSLLRLLGHLDLEHAPSNVADALSVFAPGGNGIAP
jgi:hypothetical protein